MDLDLAFLLHAYQPWWQFPSVLERITEETYLPNFSKLANDDRYRLTLNINYTLIELFKNHHLDVMLNLIQEMIDSGRIELTSTAAYHPFLPLVSGKQRDYQIGLQEDKMASQFSGLSPRGFFSPEMGYTSELASYLSARGYEYTFADDQPYIAEYGEPPFGQIIFDGGIGVFLRSKLWSFEKIARGDWTDGKTFADELSKGMRTWSGGKDAYAFLAMDFETFDHHIKSNGSYWDKVIGQLLDMIKRPVNGVNIKLVTMSELFDKYKTRRLDRKVPDGSWSTSVEDYRAGNRFPLWSDTGYFREAHNLLWKLYRLSEESVDGNLPALDTLARGVNSCTWWQLPLDNAWLATFGVNEMLKAARMANSPHIAEMRKTASDLYSILESSVSGKVTRADSFQWPDRAQIYQQRNSFHRAYKEFLRLTA